MHEKFLLSVDYTTVEEGADGTQNGALDFKTICYFDNVLINITEKQPEQAIQFLRRNFNKCTIYVNAPELSGAEDVTGLLDNGAAKVFVSFALLLAIVRQKQLTDFSRVVVSVPQECHSHAEVVGKVRDMQSELRRSNETGLNFADVALYLPELAEPGILDVLKELPAADGFSTVFAGFKTFDADVYGQVLKRESVVSVVRSTALTMDIRKHPSKASVDVLIESALSTDRPDGLFSTLVVDERGVCLGLVYSSRESLRAAIKSGRGVYQSRKRSGLWFKGENSGDVQELVKIGLDCDGDVLVFTVKQRGDGFCHLHTATCFGHYHGLPKLEKTLQSRIESAPEGSYTRRLFNDPKLLQAKIMEEASELCEAQDKEHIAAEAADLIYFAMTKCIAAGVNLGDVEKNLDLKSLKTTRRKGDAKPAWAEKVGLKTDQNQSEMVKEAASVPKSETDRAGTENGRIKMRRYITSETNSKTLEEALQRPSQRSTDDIMKIVRPIIENVRKNGDKAVLEYTHKFEKATSLTTPVLEAPFPPSLMQLSKETISAIDTSFDNIRKFHAAQKETKPLQVETMPGVVCSRFTRPIERVGLYVPGGTAVLPSTALMLGIPAMVAGCKTIVLASPPRADGTLTPEVVYAAHKIGAHSIVLAGGAQAVAAMAYGTESICKVDKILGPGNQFVTAAKMLVSNDTSAGVAIDMPAGPSEVLVIADKTANPAFVASDLLSQAEHGVDSQVVLIAVALDEAHLQAVEDELHKQANALPRVDIVRGAIEHSVTLVTQDIHEAMRLSNEYAPEHLILQVEGAEEVVPLVDNAGSVFIGMWTPESVGDYSAGVNHSLPTYGYAKQYSGVNLASFVKHITSSNLTRQGLRNVGGAVMQMARVEELEAHRRAVQIRLDHMEGMEKD